jgi:hypothetical protein
MAIGNFVRFEHVRQARAALRESGALLIPDAYDPGRCAEIAAWIDHCAERTDTEKNYAGTEVRIWNSERKHPLLAEFWSECNVFMSALERRDSEAFSVLAIRNRALAANDRPSQMGRWHIDSFRRQLKIFLFLVDVTEDSGPFEYIPGTQAAGFKSRQLLTGVYLRPGDAFTSRRRYARLDDGWVERIAGRGYRPQPVLCSSGTVMVVDTSAVHRARPCSVGTRYALTAYYR